MKNMEIMSMASVHFVCVLSIILSALIPVFLLEKFSVLETHLTWLCICSVSVAAVNIIASIVLKPNPSPKRNSLSHKVTRFLKSCLYFMISCLLFHTIIVLYGAPLLESVLETFLFAVLLSTFTTLRCLCLLGLNLQVWIRVFSKNGAMSIWDSSLQITTVCSIVGAWLGAFPIPLDWDRPWQSRIELFNGCGVILLCILFQRSLIALGWQYSRECRGGRLN
uniref:Phosphatidylinositol-glycan biosynthesis class F protein isoform X1 n=1 Tax=Geotrypetes seraphini TaxID=260995 RepID=A0A6P8Q8K9_GEOSA|nr:phosphatidylinositol-glycan biosynthesis class F protein isoform X1 [Geotrypetes seraphini]XP_033792655.1 phosphatidylinositol-glycan biosynthesis class F protein isoform X1 [Geotrypetes seraphini]